ncbi:DUF2249 domain-containing protein [Sulfurimonas sp. MAG313]|nr:DUF2249 domain-containing protein [Sulfurimonas sp. MAG313]MDF1880220.1 DUF2249 domain-containing protein [Sulfurimonas sp. MAG313]
MNIIELDVRDLPSPEPMQAALSALVKLKEGDIIHFHHRIKPDMLLPRLNNYFYEMIEDDEVHIYICKKDDALCQQSIKELIGN